MTALPWPLREADTAANNDYVARIAKFPHVRGLMTIRPEFDSGSHRANVRRRRVLRL